MSETGNSDVNVKKSVKLKEKLLVSCIAIILLSGIILAGIVSAKGKDDNKYLFDSMANGVFYNLSPKANNVKFIR